MTDDSTTSHTLPLLDYASPRTQPTAPATDVIVALIGGIVLVVMGVLFSGGGVVIAFNFRYGWRWADPLWAIVELVVGIAFVAAGLAEFRRGLRIRKTPDDAIRPR